MDSRYVLKVRKEDGDWVGDVEKSEEYRIIPRYRDEYIFNTRSVGEITLEVWA